MTWQSIFCFSFLLLSTQGNDACHRWPSELKCLFSCKDCFERLAFWSQVVYIISVQREGYGQKCSRKMSNFGPHAPKHQSKMISRYHDFGDLCFWSSIEFWRLEAVASLNAYQIINYQFLLITHHFCCLISEEFEK